MQTLPPLGECLLHLFHVLLGRVLVLNKEVLLQVLAEIGRHLVKLLAQAAHRLRIHVCVCNQVRHSDCNKMFVSMHVRGE